LKGEIEMTEKNSYAYDWNYDSNIEKRVKLFPLFQKVFGFGESTLNDFYASGFANPTYTPFTFFHEGFAIANVSMFDMPLLVNGQEISTAGIQSVMTDPEYRGKGLFKQLFYRMLSTIDDRYESSFLFTSIPELYRPFGFREVKEYFFVVSYKKRTGLRETSLRKLDIFNAEDVLVIKFQLNHFTPISHVFSPLLHAPSFYLNMFDPDFNKKLYYSKELEVIIVFELENKTLKLYDLIGKVIPTLEEIVTSIGAHVSQIEFHFHPDLFALQETKTIHTPGHLMIRGNIDRPSNFKFPKTASF
jgi:GNAT superfamily N-acetyltransferase